MAAVALRIDGAPLAPGLAASVCSIDVRQALNAPAMAVIAFADPPPDLIAPLKIGTMLAVQAPTGETLVEAEIVAVEHRLSADKGRIVGIRGYDRLHRLRKRQRVRALTDVTPEDVAAAAAADIGVSSTAPDPASPRRALVIQHDQSDFDLLVELAADCGRFFHLTDGTLTLLSLDGDGEDEVRLVAGQALLDARVELSAETMRRSTLARGWDVGSAAPVAGRASTAAQDAIEFRGEDALTRFEGLGERLLLNRNSANTAEAAGLAQADMDRAIALGATLTATPEGDPRLRPGRVVAIEGVSDQGDGSYVLTEVTHTFDIDRGYVTRISTLPSPRPPRARCAAATVARITDVADPEDLARVRGTLVAYGEVDSGWMPVLIVGAGDGKGLAVVPEPGDDVLVLLPEGDPARGIVLGGLYGSRRPPGERPEQGARNFTLRTPAGQSLMLDGVESVIRLQTSAGDLLEMTPKGTKLSVTRDLLVEAPGHRLTFRASHVDFEKL
jgi:phage baseplate assembly protein gpV/phage protein D